MMHNSIVRVDGAVVGGLWWPIGAPAAKQLNAGAERNSKRSLYDIIVEMIEREEGDFSTVGKLTADTTITVERIAHSGRATVSRSRTYGATDFPSISTLVDAEHFSSDFFGDYE